MKVLTENESLCRNSFQLFLPPFEADFEMDFPFLDAESFVLGLSYLSLLLV